MRERAACSSRRPGIIQGVVAWTVVLLAIVGCGKSPLPSPYAKPLPVAATEVDLGTVDFASNPPSSKFFLPVLRPKRGDVIRFRGILVRESIGENVPVFIDLLESMPNGRDGIANTGGTQEFEEQERGWHFVADVDIPKRSPKSLRLVVKAGTIAIAQGNVEIVD
jgi:hypothetical protein